MCERAADRQTDKQTETRVRGWWWKGSKGELENCPLTVMIDKIFIRILLTGFPMCGTGNRVQIV